MGDGIHIKTIRINDRDTREELNGKFATYSGWGETESKMESERLMKAEAYIIPTTVTNELHKDWYPDPWVADKDRTLQLTQEGGVSPGAGDSGGKNFHIPLPQNLRKSRNA